MTMTGGDQRRCARLPSDRRPRSQRRRALAVKAIDLGGLAARQRLVDRRCPSIAWIDMSGDSCAVGALADRHGGGVMAHACADSGRRA